MKIPIANQKGGVGKTTHCILLANYLRLVKRREVLAIDMDFQKNMLGTWEQDKALFDDEPPYQVLDKDLSDAGALMGLLDGVDGLVLLDLPGKMDDGNLAHVYQAADLVVCPMAYDRRSFESTHLFAQVVRHLNPGAKLVFLPNRMKSGVKYATKEQCNAALSAFGEVAPEVPDRIALQRVNTHGLPDGAAGPLMAAYGFIFDNYIGRQNGN